MSEGDSEILFDFQDRLGLFLTVLGAFISLVCVTGILLYALHRRLVKRQHHYARAIDSNIFLNLMFADLIQATGVMFNIKWVNDGIITEGEVCTTQAVVKQIGINGVSATSFAITVYTFFVLVFRWNPSKHIAIPIILSIWIFTGLVVGIPNAVHKQDVYYGQTGFWCWVLPKYQTEEILSEYLWVWVTGLSMLLLYFAMYLILKLGAGRLVNGIPSREKPQARTLLYYPAVYIICFLPNTIARWLLFTGHNPPHRFTLFANTIYALSGSFNFLVFYKTRKSVVVGPGEDLRGRDIEENTSRGNSQAVRGESWFPQPDQPAVLQNSHVPSSPSSDIPLSAIDRSSLGMPPTRWQTEEMADRDYPEHP